MRLPDEVSALGAQQLGIVTRTQLNALGVSPGLVRWHTGQRWRSLLPGVLMLNSGQASDEQRLVAALLYAGPQSWLAGASALACHGYDRSRLSLPVQVFVPHPHRSRRVSWVTIRATRLTNERIVHRGPLRLSCRPRAVVDAAADASDTPSCRALIVGAVQNRFVRLDDVQHWVGARRRNGTVRLKQAVAEAASGAWSVPEADLAKLLGGARGLPELWANPSLTEADETPLTTPDAWFDDVALAVMVHSRRFHSNVLDWDSTVMRDEDLRSAGVEVVGVTPHAIAAAPDRVVQAVLAAHARARQRPRPPVHATPRNPYS